MITIAHAQKSNHVFKLVLWLVQAALAYASHALFTSRRNRIKSIGDPSWLCQVFSNMIIYILFGFISNTCPVLYQLFVCLLHDCVSLQPPAVHALLLCRVLFWLDGVFQTVSCSKINCYDCTAPCIMLFLLFSAETMWRESQKITL